MNKIKSQGIAPIIIILIVIGVLAAGGGVYYYQTHKNKTPLLGSKLKDLSFNATTTKLATIPAWVKQAENIVFSKTGWKVAYRAEREWRKEYVFVNDEKGKEYVEIHYLTISPDGEKVAYAATQEEPSAEFVVVNGKEGKIYDYGSIREIVVSPESKSLAYFVHPTSMTQRTIVVNDSEISTASNWADNLIFSPDSKKFAYIKKHVVAGPSAPIESETAVVDGQEGKVYDKINCLVFSPDGKTLAYLATQGDQSFVVMNDKEISAYDGCPVLSPDGQKIAFKTKKNGMNVVVVNGQEGKKYSGNIDGNPIFSLDGQKVVYLVWQSGAKVIVINEQELAGAYDPAMDSFFFSPDSQKLAYIGYGRNPEGEWKSFVVLDGKKGQDYDEIFQPVFSPDGTKIMYGARNGNELWWVVDNAN